MAVKQVIEFARNLSSKPGIIKEAKFQPAQPKRATRAKVVARKPIRAVKAPQIVSIFSPSSEASPEEIQRAEEMRDDIIDIGGVDKFKALDLNVIKGYYLRLEGPKATVPPLTKAKLANIILQRLGTEDWGSVFGPDAPELSAADEKAVMEIRKEIEDRAAESTPAEELLEAGVESLDKEQLEDYYRRLQSVAGIEEPVPNLTKERLGALVLQRLTYPEYPAKKKRGK